VRLTADYEITGCGVEGPLGYRCTRHEGGLHVARGLTLDSWAEEWPRNCPECESVVLFGEVYHRPGCDHNETPTL
jgi:hypothetical protein